MPTLHTLDEAKALLGGFEDDDTAQDDVLLLLQTMIYSRLEVETGRKFEDLGETVVTFKRPDSVYLPLPALPVFEAAVTLIEYTDGAATETELVENKDFYVTTHGVTLDHVVSNADYEVTYTGGFEADTADVLILPQDAVGLKRAALLQLIHEYNTRQKPGVETIETALGSITSGGLVLLKEVVSLCKFYRHPAREMIW